MSQINEPKHTAAAVHQQPPSKPLAQRVLLIRSIRTHPRLYKHEFLRTPCLQLHEKQQIWDEISKETGLKPEEAKRKWRSLVNYLRQHMEHVIQKKQRRYIPNTKNPEDKYIQLNDWEYYKEMEFVVPYVKYAASKQTYYDDILSPTSNEIDAIIQAIEEDLGSKTDDNVTHEQLHKGTKLQDNESDRGEDNLTSEEEILKEFFENMLKSTLNLPRFHQNRVKDKLIQSVNGQKE